MAASRFGWALLLGLAVAGAMLAHVGDMIPALSEGSHHLEGHREATSWVPVIVAVLAAGAAVVVAWWHNRSSHWLASIPLAVWVSQEGLERVIGLESAPHGATAEPHFWLGLVGQLPFVIAIVAVIRLLLSAAKAVIARFKARLHIRRRRADVPPPRPRRVVPLPITPCARGSPQRAPPLQLIF